MLTQEEKLNKHICANCKWCKIYSIERNNWTETFFDCMNSITYLNPVTGDEEYKKCILVNSDGDCEMYEETQSIFNNRLFKRNGKNKKSNT